MAGVAELGGAQGGHGPPDFPRINSDGLTNAQAAQGLLALAPPDFFTFRRPCSAMGPKSDLTPPSNETLMNPCAKLRKSFPGP